MKSSLRPEKPLQWDIELHQCGQIKQVNISSVNCQDISTSLRGNHVRLKSECRCPIHVKTLARKRWANWIQNAHSVWHLLKAQIPLAKKHCRSTDMGDIRFPLLMLLERFSQSSACDDILYYAFWKFCLWAISFVGNFVAYWNIIYSILLSVILNWRIRFYSFWAIRHWDKFWVFSTP